MNHADSPDKKADLLLRFMAQRKLLGFEKSFKIFSGALLPNRFLLGVSKAELPQNSLYVICERLAMPDDQLSMLTDSLRDADVVHFGFEENDGGCVYKVYLEYARKIAGDHAAEPMLLHFAFKWNPSAGGKSALAEYIYHPGLTTAQIAARLSAIYSEAGNPSSFRLAQDIIATVSAGLKPEQLMYIEVSEQGNPRMSFDLNLYEANMRLADIEDLLFGLQRHYGVPDAQFEPLYRGIKDCRLGHLSGGIDRKGRDFFTVYYDSGAG